MPIGRKRRAELRLQALSIVWRVLDQKVKDVALAPELAGLASSDIEAACERVKDEDDD